MKELIMVRHAKSSWANIGQDDFSRPLNERGHHDAPMMAERLIDKGIKIDQFISSNAFRAFTTATYFAKAWGQESTDIVQYQALYHAPPVKFIEAIIQINDNINTAAIFAHNPGITEFVNLLTETKIDDMPTCGIFAIKLEITSWKDFKKAPKQFWFFKYPKQLP